MKIITDNVCHACQARRKKKLLRFTENFVPYCYTYWVCNENHPNHPSQTGNTKLYNHTELYDMMKDKLPDEAQTIKQLMNKPLSVRLSDYRTIRFLLDIKASQELPSLSDAVRHCIEYTISGYKPEPVITKEQTEVDLAEVNEEDLTF